MGASENRGWEGYGRRETKRRVFMLVLKGRKAEETGGITQQCLIFCNRKITKRGGQKEEQKPELHGTGEGRLGFPLFPPPPRPTLMTSLKGNGELREF